MNNELNAWGLCEINEKCAKWIRSIEQSFAHAQGDMLYVMFYLIGDLPKSKSEVKVAAKDWSWN